MYNIVADLHTHTLASTHAYSTVSEMILAAKGKGLYAIGITDHSYTMPGAPGPWYFENLYQLPLFQNEVKVIVGIEANIMDFNGTIDYDKSYMLDIVIASVHDIKAVNLPNPTIEKCTEMYLNIAKNPFVNIIGHSGTPEYKYDYDKVIPEFKRNNKLVEINAHTFDVRVANIGNCREIALACKKHKAPIIVNSDAHFQTEIGAFNKALNMLEEIDFPEELIVNSSVQKLNEYLNAFTNINANRTK